MALTVEPGIYIRPERGAAIAPLEACRAFGMPPGTQLWLCRRLRRYEGRPHSVTLNAQNITGEKAAGEALSAWQTRHKPSEREKRAVLRMVNSRYV